MLAADGCASNSSKPGVLLSAASGLPAGRGSGGRHVRALTGLDMLICRIADVASSCQRPSCGLMATDTSHTYELACMSPMITATLIQRCHFVSPTRAERFFRAANCRVCCPGSCTHISHFCTRGYRRARLSRIRGLVLWRGFRRWWPGGLICPAGPGFLLHKQWWCPRTGRFVVSTRRRRSR
jgi:hypothetical protein